MANYILIKSTTDYNYVTLNFSGFFRSIHLIKRNQDDFEVASFQQKSDKEPKTIITFYKNLVNIFTLSFSKGQ